MEYIKKEELIEGEIYTHQNGNICRCDQISNTVICGKYINITHSTFRKPPKNPGNFAIEEMRLATPEEKHWLNSCIEQDKFITFEEAMETFIPEYVECISLTHPNITIINFGEIGKIYKVLNYNLNSSDMKIEGYLYSVGKKRFKPSTKEAYDAQFVVKELEFVLPEKWCVLRNNEHFEEIGRWFNKINNDDDDFYTNSIIKSSYPYLNNSGIQGNCLSATLINGYTEITFEQFKKYVLKEEIIEEKVIEPLPQFKVIETIETITKVENNEGNQFFIGDVVISDSGFVQTIKSFRYNVNKDNVLATTNVCNQISIARLEHYIEPKVEETLLEKAKRLYPVGTKFINPNDNRECVIKEKGNYFEGNNHNIYHSIANKVFKYEEGLSGCIYINNTWSKIIE